MSARHASATPRPLAPKPSLILFRPRASIPLRSAISRPATEIRLELLDSSSSTLPYLHTEWLTDGTRPASVHAHARLRPSLLHVPHPLLMRGGDAAGRLVRRRDIVGTVRLPLDRLAMFPAGVLIAKMLVGGWDDVVAVRVSFEWDPVRTACGRAHREPLCDAHMPHAMCTSP